MTRVIAGRAGGRRLAVPPGTGTRPTSDRAREGLFSTWEALLGTLDGIRIADLYAGSGAVGLEALSRGAAHALLVEADTRAARTVRDNVAALKLPGAEVRAGKAEQIVTGPAPAEPYDVVFLDPPYAVTDDDLREILLTLGRGAGSRRTVSSPWSAAPEAGNSAGPKDSKRCGPVVTARARFGTVAPPPRAKTHRETLHDRTEERGTPDAPRRLSRVL